MSFYVLCFPSIDIPGMLQIEIIAMVQLITFLTSAFKKIVEASVKNTLQPKLSFLKSRSHCIRISRGGGTLMRDKHKIVHNLMESL